MLKITEAQLAAFGNNQRKRFCTEVALRLRSLFPDEVRKMSEADLVGVVERGVEKAHIYDISLEPDVERYVQFAVGLGEDFDVNAKTGWTGHILRRKEIIPSERLDLILESLAFQGR